MGHQYLANRIKNLSVIIKKITAAGENVAFGYINAQEVVKGWVNSSGHQSNILGNYNLTLVSLWMYVGEYILPKFSLRQVQVPRVRVADKCSLKWSYYCPPHYKVYNKSLCCLNGLVFMKKKIP